MAQSDWQYHADHGTSRFEEDGAFEGLRAVFSVHPEPFRETEHMAGTTQGKGPLSEDELQDMVASSDGGARNPTGAVAMLFAVVAVVWSLYRVLLASPLAN